MAPSPPGSAPASSASQHDPLHVLADPNAARFDLPELSLPTDVSLQRLQQRQAVWQILDAQQQAAQSRAAEGLASLYDSAHSMLLAPSVRSAFDLTASRWRSATATAARPTARAACSRGGWSKRA